MPKSEAAKRAQAKYEASGAVRDRTKVYCLKCHIEHDADIVERLETIGAGAKATYIKELIREDIKRNG